MNTAILNELNRIRFMEQKKLLDPFRNLLKQKKIGRLHNPLELIKNLATLHEEPYTGNNYETAISNYIKLRGILLLMLNKHKLIKSELNKIEHNLNKLNEFQVDDTKDFPLENTHESTAGINNNPLIKELEASVSSIKAEMVELNKKLKSNLPEQLDLKPLVPFHFIHKDAKITKRMISIIVLNDNGAGHLKNLFESFIKFNSYNNYRFIMVDRASTDDSVEIARSYKDKLQLEIVSHEHKYTASYLNNLAVDACRSEFLLFLNNKTVFQYDILPLYLDHFGKDNSTGIIGASVCKPCTNDSSEKDVHYGSVKFKINETEGLPDIPFPLFDPEFLALSGIETSIKGYRGTERTFIPPGFFLTCLKPFPVSHKKKSGVKIVPAVFGSSLFCKRSGFIQAGGFDLNYFNGYEDIDLCLKFAKRLNKKTVLTHDIEIQLNTDNIIAEFSPTAKSSGNYNLGTLLNKHGYFIKNKYFNDMIQSKQVWTNDSIQNINKSQKLINSLYQVSPEGSVDLKDEELVKKITTGYLDGIRNNKLRIAIKIPAYNDENAQFWGDYHFAHSLKNAFIKKGHPARVDLFDFWHEQGYMTDDVVIALRGIKRYHTRGSQINIMWNISHPEKIDQDEYDDYDHIFVASNVFAQELKEKFNINAENLLQCTDPGVFYPDTSQIEDQEKTDILYVANSRGVMRKAVEFTMQKEIPATIYGTNWEKFLPAELIKGNYIKNEELRKYYSNCNILLNDHWQDMVDCGYISNRIFDALACGAIVLTDRVNGIEQTFRNGLYFYSNADELAEQVKWIRANFQEAKQLALKNSKKILKIHTFDLRAERILEVIMKIHQQKTTSAPVEVLKMPDILSRWLDFKRIYPTK